jgi:glycosyltransferase involved in cell wall biosynthesis
MGNPLVSVCMITYNHEFYIREAIEAVLMQKTNFPIELIIGEDCSNDNTRKIVREYEKKYPAIIVGQYPETNRGMMENFTTVLQSARGKYIALCEGDDYWTDPLKLQKQVDFLEENGDYSLCVGGFKKVNVYTNETENIIKNISGLERNNKGYTFTLNDTKKSWITKTLTAVFRNDKNILNQITNYKYGRDINLFYHILKTGKGYYFTEIMGVYRIHEGGVNSMKHGETNIIAAFNIYKELYSINKDDFTRHMYLRATFNYLNFSLHDGEKDYHLIKNLIKIIKSIIRNISEYFLLLKVLIPIKIK